MQWWCSASGKPWTWTPQYYPGVWLMVAVLAVAFYALARRARASGSSRATIAGGWFGVLLVWLVLDWPLGPLAAGYLASAHAVQFVILALLAPPLVLRAVRRPLVQHFDAPRPAHRVVEIVTRPVLAGVLFNIIAVATHVPVVVDRLMPTQLGAFVIDLLWLTSGVLLWWPILVAKPARPWFSVPVQVVYLFLSTLVHTGIAMVMLIREYPMYGIYELAPPWPAWTPLEDQHLAGGVMELAGAVVIFGIMTVMFFRWSGGVTGDTPPSAPPRE